MERRKQTSCIYIATSDRCPDPGIYTVVRQRQSVRDGEKATRRSRSASHPRHFVLSQQPQLQKRSPLSVSFSPSSTLSSEPRPSFPTHEHARKCGRGSPRSAKMHRLRGRARLKPVYVSVGLWQGRWQGRSQDSCVCGGSRQHCACARLRV